MGVPYWGARGQRPGFDSKSVAVASAEAHTAEPDNHRGELQLQILNLQNGFLQIDFILFALPFLVHLPGKQQNHSDEQIQTKIEFNNTIHIWESDKFSSADIAQIKKTFLTRIHISDKVSPASDCQASNKINLPLRL